MLPLFVTKHQTMGIWKHIPPKLYYMCVCGVSHNFTASKQQNLVHGLRASKIPANATPTHINTTVHQAADTTATHRRLPHARLASKRTVQETSNKTFLHTQTSSQNRNVKCVRLASKRTVKSTSVLGKPHNWGTHASFRIGSSHTHYLPHLSHTIAGTAILIPPTCEQQWPAQQIDTTKIILLWQLELHQKR